MRGLIYSNLVVGGRRRRYTGSCLASVPGLSATVWSSENHFTAPVLSSGSKLGKVRQAQPHLHPYTSTPPPPPPPPPLPNVLIKSTLCRAKRDNRGKVGRLHSLSQEEEVPWCTFTCAWCLAGAAAAAAAATQCVAQLETRQRARSDQRAAALASCVSCV